MTDYRVSLQPMDEEHERLAHSFASVAEAYDRGRPSFPREAVEWLVGKDPATVLEVGAGTGKLTGQLVAAGHDVHATEPSEEMLDILRRNLPDTRATQATSAIWLELASANGSMYAPALAQDRPDIAARLGNTNMTRSGFRGAVRVEGLATGDHRLWLAVVSGGSVVRCDSRLLVRVGTRP